MKTSTNRAATLGLLLALFGNFLAFMLAGAGHGWCSPIFVSPALFVAYPFVLVRGAHLEAKRSGSSWVDLATLALALAADVHFVLFFTSFENTDTLLREHVPGEGFLEAWVVIWIGWQFLALRNFVRAEGWRARGGPSSSEPPPPVS